MSEPADVVARLLPAARSGSKEALGGLFEACRGYLLVIARRELDPGLRAKGEPADLVQQTFLEAQRDFAGFKGDTEAELLGWLRRVLLNNVASFRRRYRATGKRQVTSEVPLEAGPGPAGLAQGLAGLVPCPHEQAIGREQAQAVRQALGRLPEVYRQVLTWRYQEQCPFEEIGRLLQRSPNAARKLWARALERLQQELGGLL